MAWIVVPALEALRRELDELCPHRDKTSDGGVGDTSHAAGKSSHNPDETGNPEYSDHDGRDEIRARDFDRDLNHPTVTAEDVVQHLLTGARTGRFWWLRYIIFDRRIWSKSGGWNQQAYSGVNPHDHHFHVNTDYTQAADTVAGVDYGLRELIDMDQKEALLVKTSNPGRTVGNVLGDLSNLRDWLISPNTTGIPTPPAPESFIGQLHAVIKAFPALQAQVAAIRAGVDRDDADEAQIAALVLAGMDYRRFADAVVEVLPKQDAQRLLDALAARLAA